MFTLNHKLLLILLKLIRKCCRLRHKLNPRRRSAKRRLQAKKEEEKVAQMMQYVFMFVKKKDCSLRLCIDYRGLNHITIKDSTPLPNIAKMNDRLRKAKWFTKIDDLRDGFWNILIQEKDRYKTVVRTRIGNYKFNVLPFGLCNSPATFMRMMNRIAIMNEPLLRANSHLHWAMS